MHFEAASTWGGKIGSDGQGGGALGDETFPARILEYVGCAPRCAASSRSAQRCAQGEAQDQGRAKMTNVRHLEYRRKAASAGRPSRSSAFAQLPCRPLRRSPWSSCECWALTLCLEGVSQMDSIPPGRLLALVRPGNDLVLRRIRNLKRCLFFGTPFLGPLFCFFLFFLSPAKVGSLEMQPGAKLQAYLGVIMLQPHACTQRFRFRIRTRSFPGRTSARSLSQVE